MDPDAGISKTIDVDHGELPDSDMTLAGQLIGTPEYMSPEQIRDSQSVTVASDIYSVGITLFHALAGLPPFAADSVAGALHGASDDAAAGCSRTRSSCPRIARSLVAALPGQNEPASVPAQGSSRLRCTRSRIRCTPATSAHVPRQSLRTCSITRARSTWLMAAYRAGALVWP